MTPLRQIAEAGGWDTICGVEVVLVSCRPERSSSASSADLVPSPRRRAASSKRTCGPALSPLSRSVKEQGRFFERSRVANRGEGKLEGVV